MAGKTDYTATSVLAWVTGKTAMPSLPTAYIGLFTTAPTSDNGVTGAVEVSGPGYGRVATTGSTWNVPTNSVGSEPSVTPAYTSNAAIVSFPPSTGIWGTCTAFGIFDAATSGHLLWWDYLGADVWSPFTCSIGSPGVLTVTDQVIGSGVNVVFTTKFGGTLPSVSSGSFAGVQTTFAATGTTFNIGANTTTVGDGQIRVVAPQYIGSGITPSFNVGAFVLTDA